MLETPKGLRLHIGIFGRRNSGKSTLMNALIGQPVSIVSPQPGTTTDPVEKTFELAPLGPVVFIDTAGLDDVGELGALQGGVDDGLHPGVLSVLSGLDPPDAAAMAGATRS